MPPRAACPQPDTAQAGCSCHQERGQSTTELSSVHSQPAAFPRKGSPVPGRIWGSCRPSRRSAPALLSAPHCPDERWAMIRVLSPLTEPKHQNVPAPSWEQPRGQALLHPRGVSSQPSQETTGACSRSVRAGLCGESTGTGQAGGLGLRREKRERERWTGMGQQQGVSRGTRSQSDMDTVSCILMATGFSL